MEVENNMEATKAKTNANTNPMGEHDAPLKGELMNILVFQLQLCICWFILMHTPLSTLSHQIMHSVIVLRQNQQLFQKKMEMEAHLQEGTWH